MNNRIKNEKDFEEKYKKEAIEDIIDFIKAQNGAIVNEEIEYSFQEWELEFLFKKIKERVKNEIIW